MKKYTNRYGDEYQFIPQENGNILWKGPFEYYRTGYDNNYLKAYDKYCRDHIENWYDGERMTLDEFKEKIHEYDDEKKKWVMGDYVGLVESDTSKITMVDPSGGPYLSGGNIFDGRVISHFESVDNGFLIIFK